MIQTKIFEIEDRINILKNDFNFQLKSLESDRKEAIEELKNAN